jgi:uncharacterized protein (DUF2062 family)
MDLRRYLQTRLPKASELSERRFIGWFGHRLHDPNLWHFGRRSVARATALGLLLAFFPIPIQMTIIVPLAILRGINLPVAIAALWVTNPLTWVPLFYAAYRVGLLFTGGAVQTAESLRLGANWESLSNALGEIWLPLCLGSAILGVAAAATGYFLIDGLWRLAVARRWRKRAERRRAQA